MTEPQYVVETLAWCNRKRKEQGREPLLQLPKGKPRDPLSCPCGQATGLFVYEQMATDRRLSDSPTLRFSLPRAVQRFVKAFDAGRLPQYEAKP